VEDPRSTRYNFIGHTDIAVTDETLKVPGMDNLFCGGEKANLGSVGTATTSGYLAGHNAARMAFGKEPLILPRTLALGHFFAYAIEKRKTAEGRQKGINVGRGEYWEEIQHNGLYTDDVGKIKRRVEEAGLLGVLAKKLA
jgi:hypothetical protein